MARETERLRKNPVSDERYTPKWVFERLAVTFDVDVASPVEGPRHTPCRAWYSIQHDALTQPWFGLVWMNPPYSTPKPWIAKFRDHANGIALIGTSQGRWFYDLWYDPNTRFVPMPSIKFETIDGPMPTAAPWRSWLVGIGDVANEALDRWELC